MPSTSALRAALQRYIDARQAAIIEARRALGVNELDARAILYIAANPGVRPTQLRDHLGVTAAGVTTLIDRLVARDVVRRDVDPDDRRVNRIGLVVDLRVEPWSQLTRFDDDFEAVSHAGDPGDGDRFAGYLDALTDAALAASR